MDKFMQAALTEAHTGAMEHGIPIGAALVDGNRLVATGRNRRLQDSAAIMHAEINCLYSASRKGEQSFRGMTMYSTLMPCQRLRQQLVRLAEGDFVDRDVNVLAFGLPGTGKTHAMCAIGHRLVQSGRSVLFIPAYRLVQDMLAAKRDLDLPRMLRKLDNYDLLVIDDLGYLPQGAEESEVLFTLIAERYERRSLGITSNLVFSEWEKVFSNPMATAAAIDRIVHHSVILEFDMPSYRTSEAQGRQARERQLQTTITPDPERPK